MSEKKGPSGGAPATEKCTPFILELGTLVPGEDDFTKWGLGDTKSPTTYNQFSKRARGVLDCTPVAFTDDPYIGAEVVHIGSANATKYFDGELSNLMLFTGADGALSAANVLSLWTDIGSPVVALCQVTTVEV